MLATYNLMLTELDTVGGMASLISNVHPDRPIRDAAEACERRVQTLANDQNLDPDLYAVVKGIDISTLDAGAKRFVEKVLRDFRRSGVDKDDATRAKLKQLHDEMVEVGQAFSRTIRDDVRQIEVDSADELKGLPDDFIKAHAPNEAGKIVLTTNYPDYFPVQQYAENTDVRKRLTEVFLARGYPANEATLQHLLELRHTYAETLGYKNWVDYTAEVMMAKDAKTIGRFIEDVAKIARPRMKRDLKTLLARKRKDDRRAKQIETWDRFYYVEKVRADKYGFDARSVRPYFEFGRVTEGLMKLYGALFGVRFERVTDAPVWHPSVLAYDLYMGDTYSGRFYLDMHPREGKYGHAAMFSMVTGVEGGQTPQAALVCNFPDPSHSDGPALMEHDEVVTYFHEFGHLVHHLLARGSPWVNQTGISTEPDFVEAPSQLLEEWAWDAKSLQQFAKHIDTNEPIPTEVVEKMRASSEFGKGVHVMRQVFYTALSYDLHEVSPKNLKLDQFAEQIERKYSPYPHIANTHVYASFGHLDGYSSMYYTYQWSLVLAKDIFTRFEKSGLDDLTTARAYRDEVLLPGGTRPAAESVKAFLGRTSNLSAYRAWLERE